MRQGATAVCTGAKPCLRCADGNKCLPLTKELVTGMCLPFMAQFQTDGARLAKLSERDFRQAIAIGPTPSDRCCRDAKDFTMAVSHTL